MPVVAAIEAGRERAWRSDISIAVKYMADMVRVLFAHAGERELGKTLSGVGVELRRIGGRGD